MKFNNNIIILLLNIVNFGIVNSSIFKKNELNNFNCKRLNIPEKEDYYYKIKYDTYSFINNVSYSFYSECFYVNENNIIVCNDKFLHFFYIFKISDDVLNQYGDYKGTACSHNNTEIFNWNLYHNNILIEENLIDFGILIKEPSKFSFKIIFSNNCSYDLPVQEVYFDKTYKIFSCRSNKVKKI